MCRVAEKNFPELYFILLYFDFYCHKTRMQNSEFRLSGATHADSSEFWGDSGMSLLLFWEWTHPECGGSSPRSCRAVLVGGTCPASLNFLWENAHFCSSYSSPFLLNVVALSLLFPRGQGEKSKGVGVSMGCIVWNYNVPHLAPC